jgi:hypothetical protein
MFHIEASPVTKQNIIKYFLLFCDIQLLFKYTRFILIKHKRLYYRLEIDIYLNRKKKLMPIF